MPTPAARNPLAALRRAAARTVSEGRPPSYVADYLRGRAVAGAARALRPIEPALRAPGRALARRSLSAILRAGRDRRLVRVAGSWQVAVRFREGSAQGVAAENERFVVDALRARGTAASVRCGVASLAAADRAAALDALVAAAVPADPVYIALDSGAAAGLLVALDPAARDRMLASSCWTVYRNHWLSDRVVIGREQALRLEFGGDRQTSARGSGEVEIAFPVDVVYTWVDGSDPEWRRSYEAASREHGGVERHALSANASRYCSRDELRFSMRSLALHAPWVRRVFLVTCGQVPDWLALDGRVTVVRHEEILDAGCLPTFSSHAIETALHRIEGLAEHYLYLNDDVFMGRAVSPSLFFDADGTPYVFPDETAPIPSGPATSADAPVDAAAKNVRDLIEARFGTTPDLKMLHVVHPQRRSILSEIEGALPEELARTAANRFRDPTDVSVASCLSHYYALATGRARRGTITSEYVNVADRWAPVKMHRLARDRDRDVFCVNETEVPENRVARVDRMVTRFLADYFPVSGGFEAPRGADGTG